MVTDKNIPSPFGYDGVIVANSIIRGANQFLHDEITLEAILKDAGFEHVVVREAGKGQHFELCKFDDNNGENSKFHEIERFILEAW